jgi:hypothetical protein
MRTPGWGWIKKWVLNEIASSSGADIVDDVTPQLGAMLDVNAFGLGDGTLELLDFTEVGSAVNQFDISNAATGNGPILAATGGDSNIDTNITPKGTGKVKLNGSVLLAASLDAAGFDFTNIGAEDFDTTDKGSLSSSTTITVADDTKQKFTVTGAFTLTITFGAASGHYQEVELEVVNGAAYVITWPTINWYKSDGTTSTTIGDLTAQLQASGTNVAIVWTRDGGTTKYGVLA